MAKNEEKTETKDTTTEATPQDQNKQDKVDILVEKTLAAEKKKRQMRPETKTALGALILVLFSLLCLWICNTTDNVHTPNNLVGVFLIGLAVSILVSFILARFVTWNKDKKDFTSIPAILLLWCISFLPFVIGIVPLSKYHNQNQIERDKKIVEVLEITVLENEVEVLLPSEYASENSYLEKVFSVTWMDEQLKAWKEIVIPCREGDKYWYKVKLPFPDWYRQGLIGPDKKTDTAGLILSFDHAWYDYETTKEISFPDPNE